MGQIAQSLLVHWKDLKDIQREVFRIPRLEREKRQADEAEADQKTKEDKDKQTEKETTSNAVPRRLLEEDHPPGQKRRCLTGFSDTGRDPGSFNKRPFNNSHHSSNQFHNHNISNATTHAERQQLRDYNRKLFEYNVRLEKWKAEVLDYNLQLQLVKASSMTTPQQLDNSSPLSLASQSSAMALSNISLSDQTELQPGFQLQSSSSMFGQSPEVSMNNLESFTSLEESYDTNEEYFKEKEKEENDIELSLQNIVPKFESSLIILLEDSEEEVSAEYDVNLSPIAIDNVDYNDVRYYCDDVFESMEKRLFDEIYPPPGIFYITPSGETYFMAMHSDMSQPITVKENVAEPLPLSYTKRNSENIMLPANCDWSYAEFEGETYYYNKRKQIKQWNPPQSSQIGTCSNMVIRPVRRQPSLKSKRLKELSDSELNFESHLSKDHKQIHDRFRIHLSSFVVKCLGPYNRRECKRGRITNSDDFKYLARKVSLLPFICQFCFFMLFYLFRLLITLF